MVTGAVTVQFLMALFIKIILWAEPMRRIENIFKNHIINIIIFGIELLSAGRTHFYLKFGCEISSIWLIFFFQLLFFHHPVTSFQFSLVLSKQSDAQSFFFFSRTFYNNFIVERVFVHTFIFILITHHSLSDSFCSN